MKPSTPVGKWYSRHSIGTRVLLIALLPSLVTAGLLTALLVRQKMAETESAARTGLLSAARNLAAASQYGLISGNLDLLQQTIDRTRQLEHLEYARIRATDNALSVHSGDAKVLVPAPPPGEGRIVELPGFWLTAAPVTLPEVELDGAELGGDRGEPRGSKIIGHALVAISTAPMRASRRDALLLASALALASALLTAFIAWRLSAQLTRRIRHISRTVDKIAGGELHTRVEVQPTTELGTLEDGINRMARSLQAHQVELEVRITHATSDLLAKKEEAERANISKTRFFAAASHDLRQPLHALALFSEVLGQKLSKLPPNPELSTLAEQIASSVSSMQALLNALLDVSRLEANIIEVRRKHFPANQLFEQIRQQYAESAKAKGLVLRIRPCRAILHTDPVLLERILLNLVSNAIRYTQQGGVLVGCRRRGGMLHIQVWDTGIGIPEESRQTIFEEFVQLDNPERDRNKGLGLGLAIVARMAALLGHAITLRSLPGSGSVFDLEVPTGSPGQPAQIEVVPVAGRTLEGLRGVLVDDEESILGAMSELFKAWNIELVAARNAAEALEQLHDSGRRPDFLISDYRLPGNTNGIKVATLFREQFGADLPALILTGDTAPATLKLISEAGYAILHKPVKPARLRAMLMHLLS